MVVKKIESDSGFYNKIVKELKGKEDE